jgi:NADH-quinone oxidoreductase subunit E
MTMEGMIDHRLYVKENRRVAFTAETLKKVQELILHYPPDRRKSALLPVLHIAQQELGGYLSVDVMDYVASLLEIQPIEVYEVATFYTMFHLEPAGKFVIEVCETGPCAMSGGEHILSVLENKLGIRNGETTSDGLFSLKTVQCLGSCGSAPVIQVNTNFYESMTEEKIGALIDEIRKSGKQPTEEEKWAELF